MNRDCNGDVFERAGDTWARCLMDGKLFPAKFIRNNVCPNCRRDWVPVDADATAGQWNPDASPEVAMEIDAPYLRTELGKTRLALLWFWEKFKRDGGQWIPTEFSDVIRRAEKGQKTQADGLSASEVKE